MAILRSSEIGGMSEPEMDEQITQLRKELMKINGVLASGGIPEEVGKAREIRRTIARLKTKKAQLKKSPAKSTKEVPKKK